MTSQPVKLGVSECIAVVNQVLDGAFPSLEVEGEVASYKVNQGKFVFFDLKDSDGTLGCFMTVWQQRVPIEDGMKVIVRATPKLTPWGKFSLTVQSVRPSGQGSLKKSFELLKAKLQTEGLFAAERKRPLPAEPSRVAVISSTQAAGYADFIEILTQRWGGLDIQVAHTQVQGEAAPDQMIRAIEYFNQAEDPADVLVLIRGGGSADDLAAYNDERLVRAIAGSRIPTLVGVGHEVDVTLADMVADVRAATPSNAAQILVPDAREIIMSTREQVRRMASVTERALDEIRIDTRQWLRQAYDSADMHFDQLLDQLKSQRATLHAYDPQAVLRRGYAVLRGEIAPGNQIEIMTEQQLIQAEVRDVKNR